MVRGTDDGRDAVVPAGFVPARAVGGSATACFAVCLPRRLGYGEFSQEVRVIPKHHNGIDPRLGRAVSQRGSESER